MSGAWGVLGVVGRKAFGGTEIGAKGEEGRLLRLSRWHGESCWTLRTQDFMSKYTFGALDRLKHNLGLGE